MYSSPIRNLITAFSKLPSVGPRTAERYVFYILKTGKKDATELALALENLVKTVKSCEICWDFTDQSPCAICGDKKRDQSTICVVEDPQDKESIEKTGQYTGVYHILRGLVESDDVESSRYLKIQELLIRAKLDTTKEIILALNPDLSGETTMMLLTKQLKATNPKLKITRLARGLPMGSDLEYADEITLGSALKNRTNP